MAFVILGTTIGGRVFAAPIERLLTFEDVRASLNGTVTLASGYGGVHWRGVAVGTFSAASSNSALAKGVVSGSNALSATVFSTAIFSGRPFSFRSAWISSPTVFTAPLFASGYRGSTRIYSSSLTVNSNSPTRITFNFENVTSVRFSSQTPGATLIMDDITIAPPDAPLRENPWFTLGPTIFTYEPAKSVVAGDFDGDGRNDLAHFSTNSTVIQLNNGDGTFRETFPDPNAQPLPGSDHLAVADVNRDGRADVLVPGYYASYLIVTNANTVLEGNTRWQLINGETPVTFGDFDGSFRIIVASPAHAITLGDFNRDGRLDYAYSFESPTDLVVITNSLGTEVPITYSYAEPVTEKHYSMANGDFDGDGDLDLAMANYQAGTIAILRNDGGAGFASRTNFNAGAFPAAIVVRDVTGDGALDLVVRSAFSGLSVLPGNGDGTFRAPVILATADAPTELLANSLAVEDLNGDGTPDIAFVSGSEIVILYNVATPLLRVEPVADFLRIHWPANFAKGIVIETATNLAENAAWTPSGFPSFTEDNRAMIFDSARAAMKFFRVRRPTSP